MTPKFNIKSRKQQALDAELGLIIDEMGKAMWDADKQFINEVRPLTTRMSMVLGKFQDYCARYYGK